MENATCLIPLTQGQSAIVSPEDYEWAMGWKWHVNKNVTTYGFRMYAARWERRPGGGYRNRRYVRLHVEIAKRCGLPEAKEYDHRDKNGLNDARDNLRPATHRQNCSNRSKSAGKTSKYKGVYWHKVARKWRASIRVNWKLIILGMFDSEIEAAAVYAAFAIFYHGEFASFG